MGTNIFTSLYCYSRYKTPTVLVSYSSPCVNYEHPVISHKTMRYTFCAQSKESVEHLFFDCAIVKSLWNELFTKLTEKCSYCKNIEVNKDFILFRIQNEFMLDKILSLILIMAKYFIYRSRCFSDHLNMNLFKMEEEKKILHRKILPYRKL